MTQNSGRDAPRPAPHHRSANPVRKSECVFSTANGLLPPSEVIPLPPIRHKERVPRKHSEIAATFNRLYVTQTHDKGVSPPGRGSSGAGGSSISPKRDTCRKPYVEPKPPHTVIKGEQVDSLVKRLAQIPKRLIYAASTPHQPTHASTVVLGPIGDQEPPEYDAKRDAHLCIYWARRELLLQQERRRRERGNSRSESRQRSKRENSESYNRASLPDSDGPQTGDSGRADRNNEQQSPQRAERRNNNDSEKSRQDEDTPRTDSERESEPRKDAKQEDTSSHDPAPESEPVQETVTAPESAQGEPSDPSSEKASDPALHNEPEATPQKSGGGGGEAEDSAPSPAYSSEYEEPSPRSPA